MKSDLYIVCVTALYGFNAIGSTTTVHDAAPDILYIVPTTPTPGGKFDTNSEYLKAFKEAVDIDDLVKHKIGTDFCYANFRLGARYVAGDVEEPKGRFWKELDQHFQRSSANFTASEFWPTGRLKRSIRFQIEDVYIDDSGIVDEMWINVSSLPCRKHNARYTNG
ncbi:hypothetical protein CYMTET_7465 [Cymbomonas tetramitiformis]|uniref:Uncharacterized protein n=1 Tax=Cymbomonas tetramitiformis TaxID=36881 RepID=A0AAE0LHG0_9CHLO|nr:hypothetical protein CYMTET_7465 [Cymbomonas tetramitiformis]